MIDLGTVKPGSTIRIPFSSFDKDDGSSITMTNYAAADILVYKDGSTTERASTAGFTATTDFDAKTGKHLAIIDLADNTTAGFFNAGSEYLVAIDAVTVDTVTTGGWIARFRIGYPTAVLDTTIATLSTQTSFTLTAGPAEDDALNGYWAIIHDIASAVQCSWVEVSDYTGSTKTASLAAGATFTAAAGDNISFMAPSPLRATVTGRPLDVSATGEAGIDWGNVGSPTTANNFSGTTISTSQAVASVSGAVGSVTGNVGGNVTGSIGSLAAQAKADVNAEVDSALDTAIPGTPTADSINERIKTLDDAYTATRAGYLDNLDATISSRLAAASITLTGGQVSIDAASKTGLRLSATGLSDISATILTTALTESYAADGAAPTLSQAIFAIQQMMQERAIVSTTMTVKKLDGTTAAMTFTLDSASSPTSITRAT